jgi:integrase
MEITAPTVERPRILTSFERWWRTKNRSMATVANYCYVLERLAATIWHRDHGAVVATSAQLNTLLHRLKRDDLREYVAARLDLVEPATVSVDVRAIRSFYAWLLDEGEIKTNPALKITTIAVPETPVPMANEKHYKALQRTCGNDTWIDRRDAAILGMLWHGGFRRGELCIIDLDHADLDSQTVLLIRTKGAKPRTVRINGEVVGLLDRFLRQRGDKPGPLFPSQRGQGRLTSNGIGQMMERRREAAGIAPGAITAHAFRRAFSVTWRRRGGSMSGLMAHNGWKSEAMVRRYGRMNAEELAQAEYDQLFNE